MIQQSNSEEYEQHSTKICKNSFLQNFVKSAEIAMKVMKAEKKHGAQALEIHKIWNGAPITCRA